jgi:hypothetical protein
MRHDEQNIETISRERDIVEKHLKFYTFIRKRNWG